jgi:hypothetical protein
MKKITTLSVILFFYVAVYSQPAAEKIHLHFDKDIYLPGETIWFKAYIFFNNQPSFLSTNFYTAVYDDGGRLLQEMQYPVFEGTCNGDFKIADTLKTQSLRIRVYTKGLVITDSARFYERVIPLYKNEPPKQILQPASKNIILQFYAEGNTPVAALQNMLVVKSTYQNGNPVPISGAVMEEETATFIDSFFTGKEGLGKLQLLPETGKTYTAVWKDETGAERKTAVIKNAAAGIVLHFEKVKDKMYYNILKNAQEAKYNTLHLIGTWGNTEVYNVTAIMNGSIQWVNKIPVDSLPEGIINFVLTDAGNTVLQNRMLVNTHTGNQPEIVVVKKQLNAKGENEIELKVPDSLMNNLSVSVTDINFLDTEHHTSITEDLWFSNDILNGGCTKEVLQAGAYQLQDLLLLTAKQDMAKGFFKGAIKPLDNYLAINARYKYKNNTLPVNNNLMLIVKDTVQGKKFYTLPAANPTEFVKQGLVFYDTAQVYYKLDKEKEATEYLTVTNFNRYAAPPVVEKIQYAPTGAGSLNTAVNSGMPLSSFVTGTPKNFNQLQTIKEVVIKSRYRNPETKRLQELDDKYASGMFKGLARGYQLNVMEDKNAAFNSDILNYIVYRIPSVSICTITGEKSLVSSRGGGCTPEGRILTFVDETELPDQIGLSSIPVSQIAYIKFINGIVVGSSFVSNNGALFIYSKKGDEPGENISSVMRKVKLKGYTVPQIFKAADYTDKNNLLNADLRTTLYWNPYIITDKLNSSIKIIFNNNDISKRLLLTVEGFNEEGRLIHIEKIIE